MGVVGIIFLRGGGLGEGAFRRSTTFGFSGPLRGSRASCPYSGDSVYLCCLRGGWGSVVRMTPYGPFYCSLPLYPQPQRGGGLVILRKRALTGTADEIFWGWFVWANAPTTSAVLGFLSVGAAYLRPRHLPFRKPQDSIRLRPSKDVRNHPQIISSAIAP